MKRLILLLIAAASMLANVWAQGNTLLVATLSHDKQLTSFYGSDALGSAHEAAAHGDIITLSPGSFRACNITKCITLRGAGFDSDSLTHRQNTILINDFTLTELDDSTHHFTMEGIYHNGKIGYRNVKDAQFVRCRLNKFIGLEEYDFSGDSQNTISLIAMGPSDRDSQYNTVTFINCKIVGQLDIQSRSDYWSNGIYSYNHFDVINSIINSPESRGYDKRDGAYGNSFYIENSIINLSHKLYDSTIKNSVIIKTDTEGYFDKSCILINNIGITDDTDLFQYATDNTNTIVANGEDIFEGYSAELNDDADFHIKASAKAQCTKSDGEIGIYGGIIPFSSTPTHPQITKFEVAPQSTSAGVLPVSIKVGN